MVDGHRMQVAPTKDGSRVWRATCECGYRSTSRRSDELAFGCAGWHLSKVQTWARVNGVPTWAVGMAPKGGLSANRSQPPDIVEVVEETRAS